MDNPPTLIDKTLSLSLAPWQVGQMVLVIKVSYHSFIHVEVVVAYNLSILVFIPSETLE